MERKRGHNRKGVIAAAQQVIPKWKHIFQRESVHSVEGGKYERTEIKKEENHNTTPHNRLKEFQILTIQSLSSGQFSLVWPGLWHLGQARGKVLWQLMLKWPARRHIEKTSCGPLVDEWLRTLISRIGILMQASMSIGFSQVSQKWWVGCWIEGIAVCSVCRSGLVRFFTSKRGNQQLQPVQLVGQNGGAATELNETGPIWFGCLKKPVLTGFDHFLKLNLLYFIVI
jgi:hypothetical protein